tara:strand:+ start:174 stop:683 length:510 start_codon:yes stop_codon:yes gene_type:complete
MSNDLMKKLEEKINEAIDTIELSRMEIIELKGQKEELENRYEDWEQRLSVLIEKFEILEEGTNSENKENVEDASDEEIEIVNNESIKAENIEVIEENIEKEEMEYDTEDNSENLELISEHEHNQKDSEGFLEEEISEEDKSDFDQSEGTVFGPNLDSYTESSESSQNYA